MSSQIENPKRKCWGCNKMSYQYIYNSYDYVIIRCSECFYERRFEIPGYIPRDQRVKYIEMRYENEVSKLRT
jgi:hypothetical protein